MRLALGLGLGLGLGCAGLGCSAEPPAVVIVAELRVAPVVEHHPWVIAFLTELASQRPPGISARLEGRSKVSGGSTPEPIFEAEERDPLAALLTAYARLHPPPPELSPVWERRPGPAWRLHFVDRPAGFAVDGEARIHMAEDGRVLLRLGAAQRERFTELSRAQLDRRIAFTIGEEVEIIPVIRSPIPGGELQLLPGHSADPKADPKAEARALLERLAAPERAAEAR